MRFLALDTETGGLSPDKHDLLTAYFAVLDEDMQPTADLYLKLKPDAMAPFRASAEALEINGIDLIKHREEAVTMVEGRDQLTAFLSQNLPADERYVLIGHNVPFDLKFVSRQLLPAEELAKFADGRRFDTMDIAKSLRADGRLKAPNVKLGTLVDFFGIPRGNAHNARNDVIMTVLIFKELKKLAQG